MTAFCTGDVIPKAHTIIGEAKKGWMGGWVQEHTCMVGRGFRGGSAWAPQGVPWEFRGGSGGFRGVPAAASVVLCF